ncbi:MAG: tRNA(fMet)-specific endonuclease VapC [Candidatus Heimdallarchaeota archaeon LC_2]|nr:MAG: tRNA(fMet)-specific endonuclease VapC [Candidatus Heimdallarchaeota archaeon LC_2]
MICLDSDFIIDFLNGQQDALEKLEELEKDSRNIVTTSINALELFVGIVGVDGISGKRIEFTRGFLANLTILNFDDGAAERSANILNSLKKSGQPIGLKDTFIAGTALENKAIILTRNIKHFERVTGLLVESW